MMAHEPAHCGFRTRLLITGFGPFPGVPVNATMRLVPELAEAAVRYFPDVRCSALLLATEWSTAPARVAQAVGEMPPDVLLHFGVSSRARGFEVESRAQNVCQASPDAAGNMPAAGVLVEKGRDMLPASLPVRHIVARLRARGLPAFVSRDAGAYLCNAVMYRSLAQQTATGVARVGFIHIPATLARPGGSNRGRSGACALTWPQALQGGLEIIAACLGRPSPQRLQFKP